MCKWLPGVIVVAFGLGLSGCGETRFWQCNSLEMQAIGWHGAGFSAGFALRDGRLL